MRRTWGLCIVALLWTGCPGDQCEGGVCGDQGGGPHSGANGHGGGPLCCNGKLDPGEVCDPTARGWNDARCTRDCRLPPTGGGPGSPPPLASTPNVPINEVPGNRTVPYVPGTGRSNDDGDVQCPDCIPGTGHEVRYCGDVTVADLGSSGYLAAREGLISHQVPDGKPFPYFVVDGIDTSSECAAHLCSEDEQQLSQREEATLLADNVRLGDAACEPVARRDEADCARPDFRKVTDQECTLARDCDDSGECTYTHDGCAPDEGCFSACPGGTQDCDLQDRKMLCVGLSRDAACAGFEDEDPELEEIECAQVVECARDEDLLDEADTAAICDGVDALGRSIRLPCEQLKQVPRDPNQCGPTGRDCFKQEALDAYPSLMGIGSAGYATAGEALAALPVTQEDRCMVAQPEGAGAIDSGGSPSNPGKSRGKSKWGVDLEASVDTSYRMEPLVFGLSTPHLSAGGLFAIDGTVMGRPVPVLLAEGGARAEICELSADATLELFGQDVSMFGFDPPEFEPETGGYNPCDAFGEEVQRIAGRAKNALVNAAGVLDKIQAKVGNDLSSAASKADALVAKGRTITQEMCTAVFPPTEITGDLAETLARLDADDLFELQGGRLVKLEEGDDGEPLPIKPGQLLPSVRASVLCERPPTRETAAKVVNTLIDQYEARAKEIPEKMLGDAQAKLDNYLGAARESLGIDDASGEVKKTLATDPGLGQSFSLIGAEAVFPIGPVSLVLAVQGTGGWGVVGELEYGIAYDLGAAFDSSGGTIAGAVANASVGPTADIGLDVFIGVGFDVAIAGASVGVGGDLTLVEIAVPLKAGLEVGVKRDGDGERPGRALPSELARFGGQGTLLRQAAFKMGANGHIGVSAKMTALQGELDVRLRVKLLFFRKTWKKRIAKFKGFSKEFRWMHNGQTDLGLEIPSPNLTVLPAIPFPKLPRVKPEDFPSLPSMRELLEERGVPVSGLDPEAIEQSFNDPMNIPVINGVANTVVESWAELLPPAVKAMQDDLARTVNGRLTPGPFCEPMVVQ